MRSHSLLLIANSLCWLSSLAADQSRQLAKRFLLPTLSILVLLCPSLAGVASAGVNTWSTSGPEGGPIQALAIDPTNPCHALRRHVGRRRLQEQRRRQELERHQHRPEHLLCCLLPSSLILQPQPRFMPGLAMVMSGGEAAASSRAPTGVGSWRAINAGLTDTAVFALAIDPSSPATLYASTYAGGVFKTTNAGGVGAAINTGLTDDLAVSALAIDPSAPATLYAGTGYDANSGRRRRLQEHQRRGELE